MERRDFVKASVASLAGLALGGEAFAQDVYAGTLIPGEKTLDGRAGNVSNGVEEHLDVTGYVREKAHRIPVVATADVVVAGGGPAGYAAAIAAAREGASVILVEKANYLGGLWTGGLVLPVLATRAIGKGGKTERATGGICMSVCRELLDRGWAVGENNPIVDPEATKYLLEKTTMDAGVQVLYNATVAGVTMRGRRIAAVLVDCITGRIALRCKQAVDCTGDGIVFNCAGDPHEARRYHMSTSYRTGGSTSPKCGGRTPNPEVHFSTCGTRQAEDCLDIFRTSELQRQHRLQIWDRIEKLRQDPECEGVYQLELAPVTGIRVTRVLNSLHNVTLDESMTYTEYDDVIGMSGICDPFDWRGRRITDKERPIWQIPYRSLLPQQTANLLVAGRCFGYDQGITWDAREISTCFVTGEAAGTAAAMAASAGSAAAEVDVHDLQAKLRKAGVRLDY